MKDVQGTSTENANIEIKTRETVPLTKFIKSKKHVESVRKAIDFCSKVSSISRTFPFDC